MQITKYIHTPKTFIHEAYKQPLAYIGVGAFIFYGFCHHAINAVIVNIMVQIGKDLPVLTHNVLTSPELAATIVQALGGVGWFSLIIWRGKNDK